jgi:hypothetical protein
MDRLIQKEIYAYVAFWSRARLSAVWTFSIDSRLGLRIVIAHHAKDCAAEKARETRHDDPGVGSDCGSSVS